MANDQDDTDSYDLSSTGTVLSLQVGGAKSVGVFLTSGSSADYELQIRGNEVDWQTVDTYTGVTDIDDGRNIPEALQVRLEHTGTTPSDTASAMLGVDN